MTTTVVRPLRLEDAPELAAVLTANREHLAPWEPLREESFFTVDEQAKLVGDALRAGNALPHAIIADGALVGRVNLANVVRGPFQSCNLGYWVAGTVAGRGIGSFAVAEVLRLAFTEYGLHRVEAATLLHNERSQHVLRKNGFERFGMAPRYLKIGGEWQDHYLFQVIAENWLAAR